MYALYMYISRKSLVLEVIAKFIVIFYIVSLLVCYSDTDIIFFFQDLLMFYSI